MLKIISTIILTISFSAQATAPKKTSKTPTWLKISFDEAISKIEVYDREAFYQNEDQNIGDDITHCFYDDDNSQNSMDEAKKILTDCITQSLLKR